MAPGLIGINQPLDYTDPTTIKLYQAETEPLPHLFDLKPENLKTFLSELDLRASCHGWVYMFNIPFDQDEQDNTASLLNQYGQLSKAQVQVEVETYMGQQNREAQDDYQIYVCLSNSLTKEAKDKMMLIKHEFTFDDTQSGVMFLKCIISASHVDTNATIRITRERLSNVDKYIGQVDRDITKLNEYVKNLLDSLAARGATTQDLLANLFKGYAAASDNGFRKYIKKKEEEYDDGNDITAEELMVLAENKYKAMVENNTWNAPD